MRKNLIIMAAVALMAASGGYFAAMVLGPTPGPMSAAPVPNASNVSQALRTQDLAGQRRPDFKLTDIHGASVSAADFDGGVWLLNFWATWCTPCVEEMPMLSRLQSDHGRRGMNVVGIALDDAEKAREFALALSIDYPVLVGLTDVMLVGRRYGNSAGMLPYSVLIDADGTIRWTHLGALKREDLEEQLDALW